MVVKANDTQKREFMGVSFDLLSVGNESMVTKMKYKSGDFVPEHSHPNEQSGYVLSGIYMLRLDDRDEILMKGDSYSIPANVEHSMEILEPGEIIDIFTPPRLDYL
jgi:quercetin dioxygenase-like cupin family protein